MAEEGLRPVEWRLSSETTRQNKRESRDRDSITEIQMFLLLNQSRAKLIRLLHQQHAGWKRDWGRGLGGDSGMRSQPPIVCSAPFYIFRFRVNVHGGVFANVWRHRHGTAIKVICYAVRF